MACSKVEDPLRIAKVNKLIAGPGPILSRMNQVLENLEDIKLLTVAVLKPKAVYSVTPITGVGSG